jgi:hypothetical protein
MSQETLNTQEKIPSGVTYDPDSDVFFSETQEYELGMLFWRKWFMRRSEFPVHDYSMH